MNAISPPPYDAEEHLPPTLFHFILRNSLWQQIGLLGVTLLSFPILYATLELPKRIMNDAIQASGPVTVMGEEIGQIAYLWLLCGLFLGAVLLGGLVKMQLNTWKGMVGERLLRRLRFRLITHVMRFPPARFRRTSQGELVSMVTGEVEPLAGIMGDAVAQPVFQAGQMLTIVAFLFIQSPWLGLAAVALIPVQAVLIPYLQRQVNRLHRERVRRIRGLSERIGEIAHGAEDLRANGGVPMTLAEVSNRLGQVYAIRYRIFRKKFFMKFVNNLLTQITPFLFYAIGGYLAIRGEITIGALVAAIAAYKDIAGPWRELLAYVNQAQETTDRYKNLCEQFEDPDLVPARLLTGEPAEIPRLTGDIVIEDAAVTDSRGGEVLSDITLTIPGGAMVGVQAESPAERLAFAQLLSRSVTPRRGSVTICGYALDDLHQRVIAQRIGVATAQPKLFDGSIGQNIGIALKPKRLLPDPAGWAEERAESLAAGNAPDRADGGWLDPGLAGVRNKQELRQWWLSITEAMGTTDFLFRSGLNSRFDAAEHPRLAGGLVALRERVALRLAEAGLAPAYHPFDPETFNSGLALAENVLFALPKIEQNGDRLAPLPEVIEAFQATGLEEDLLRVSEDLLRALLATFGDVGARHPLFRRMTGLSPESFPTLAALGDCLAAKGRAGLDAEERAALLGLPFRIAAEQMGPAFPTELGAAIEEAAARHRADLRERLGHLFVPLEADRFHPGLTALENVLWGKVSLKSETKERMLREEIGRVFDELPLLKADTAALIMDVPAGLQGRNLPQIAQERIAFVRAAIKRPDILVLESALASHSQEEREAMRNRLRALLPETTIIFLERSFTRRHPYDLFVELRDGRIVTNGAEEAEEPDMARELALKRAILGKVDAFARLDATQQRLLAFASSWVHFDRGDYLFRVGEPADGAFILVKGTAEIRWPEASEVMVPVARVTPTRMVGDLSLILNRDRNVNMIATEPGKALFIGRREFMDVMSNDVAVATGLLRAVSENLISVGEALRDARNTQNGAEARTD